MSTYLADMRGMVLLKAVITNHAKSTNIRILKNVVTSETKRVLDLRSLNSIPINNRIISGSVGILRFMELYRSSMRCTDNGVANAKKYRIYLGRIIAIHPTNKITGKANAA
jgi:hypothetical protein